MQSLSKPRLKIPRLPIPRLKRIEPRFGEILVSVREFGPAQLASPILVEPMETSLERRVEEAKSGSREAFAWLVEHYEARVFNFLCQLARNPHDAEDLTQETFIKAYKGIQRFNSAQAFSTWLFTIAKRTAFNHFRGRKEFQELSPEDELDFNDPSILLEQKDEKLSLWNLAKALKPDQYEALWLRYGEGFSIAETAAILGANQIRVRVLLHRARKHLAKRLGASNIPMP